MNIKYLLLTVALLPTLSYSDTPAQPAEKTTLQKVNDFVTWRKVAAATGVAGLVTMVGGMICGADQMNERANAAKPYVIQYIEESKKHIRINPDLDINYLTSAFAREICSSDKAEYKFSNVNPVTKQVDVISIPTLDKNHKMWKHDRYADYCINILLAGAALGVICLGTLTYALIKKLKTKPEAEQKLPKAVAA